MVEETASSSFFTAPFVIAVLALLGVVAIFIYIFRANSGLLEKIQQHEKTITDLVQNNAKYLDLIQRQGMAISNLQEQFAKQTRLSKKKSNANNTIIDGHSSKMSELEEAILSIEKELKIKRRKKPTTQTPTQPQRRVRTRTESEEDEEEEEDEDEEEEEEPPRRRKSPQNTSAQSLI